MAYAVRTRFGESRGRWVRRGVGGGATMLAMAALILLWWLFGSRIPAPPATDAAPLRLAMLPPPTRVVPRPVPRRSPPPKPGRRMADRRGGGHRAGRRHPLPPRPVPPQTGGGTPVETVRQLSAPPMMVAPVELPPIAPLPPLASPAADRTGSGPDAGSGTGTGRGTGDGAGDGAGRLVLTRADWVVKPDAEALRPFWPPSLGKPLQSGRSAVICRVRLSTRVHGCRVVAESAKGSGFGDATIRASRIFRVRPPTRNGKPIDDAWVLVGIDWDVLPPPLPPSKKGAAATPTPATAAPTP